MPKAKPGLAETIAHKLHEMSKEPCCKGMLISYTTQYHEAHTCFLCDMFVPANTLHKCNGKQAEVRDAEND